MASSSQRLLVLGRVDLGPNQSICYLDLGAPKQFAAQLFEGVERVYGDDDLADEDMVPKDGTASDSLDNLPRIGKPARLENDALEAIATRVQAAPCIAEPAQQTD